ncbi:CHAD domain-containing protein [Acinetobacter thermotolerans]|uniref:CYTH and CHAD domain-containing protein n=1 Tax=Acinetobacter thermotolerans TaxID=3151487 RepID=UPI00325BB98D
MSEIELKFQVPSHMHAQLQQDFAALTPERQHLWARYFDTEDLRLYGHNIALRQRQENGLWRQTIKTPSKPPFERLEFEIELGETQPEQCELSCYKDHPEIRELLKEALGSLKESLILQFETEVQRSVRTEKYKNSTIEIAFDQGEIRHGSEFTAVYELEFELKEGQLNELTEFFQPWIERYELWLDSRSKSDRGYSLVEGSSITPAQHQLPLELSDDDSLHTMLQKIIRNTLEHLLPNATALAAERYDSEHIHQARVAIRRLRSALRFFNVDELEIPPIWIEQLSDLFQQLGTTRDRDALAESLLPQLEAAGSPLVELPPATEKELDVSQLFRQPETNYLFLDLLRYSQSKPKKISADLQILLKRLSKLHQQVCADAKQFSELDIEDQHRTRKRVKRLRYNIEFLQSLFPSKLVKTYLKALKPLQESLGHYNDLNVAESLYEPYVKQKPKAWFVLGWLRAEQKRLQKEIQAELQDFSQIQPFWKK